MCIHFSEADCQRKGLVYATTVYIAVNVQNLSLSPLSQLCFSPPISCFLHNTNGMTLHTRTHFTLLTIASGGRCGDRVR